MLHCKALSTRNENRWRDSRFSKHWKLSLGCQIGHDLHQRRPNALKVHFLSSGWSIGAGSVATDTGAAVLASPASFDEHRLSSVVSAAVRGGTRDGDSSRGGEEVHDSASSLLTTSHPVKGRLPVASMSLPSSVSLYNWLLWPCRPQEGNQQPI